MDNACQEISIRIRVEQFNGRKFAQCCFLARDKIIGDFDQLVLLGNLELSIADLIERLKNIPDIDFKSCGKIEDIFQGLHKLFLDDDLSLFSQNHDLLSSHKIDNISFFSIPFGVESFDGEEAFLFNFFGKFVFTWRDWEDKSINSIPIKRNEFISSLQKAIRLMKSH